MKKLFIVLAVASLGFVACNNDADKTEVKDTTTVETPVTPVDTMPVTPVDTLPKADTVPAPAK